MGTYVFMFDAEFFIAKEHRRAALEAIQKLDIRKVYPNTRNEDFAFVHRLECDQAKTLEEALRAWRWFAEIDDEDNIVEIGFEGEKLGHELVLFEAIAPFVREGSSIQMAGDDGRIWRWFFSVGGVEEQEGEVIFRSA